MLVGLLKILSWVPILGWLAQEALEGTEETLIFFALNVIIATLFAVMFFGFPFLIVLAVTAALGMFAILIEITLG